MATPIRSIRIATDLWQKATQKATDEGKSVSSVVVQMLEAYVK
jgi:predicted HicB family RNase H-like nuclease